MRLLTVLVSASLALTGLASSAVAQSPDLEARLAVLEKKVANLENTRAIERLFRAYGYYFDKGLWKETTTLFTDDAVVEVAQRGVFRGKAGVERLYTKLFGRDQNCLQPGGLNNHLILQPIISVDDDGVTATGRARIIGMLAVRGKDFMLQEGIYNLQFRKDGGIWRISDLHYYGDIYAIVPQALAQYPIPQSATSKDVPPDEPPSVVYESYPGYFVPEFPYPNPVTGKKTDVAECNARPRQN
jgi:SnoaL-like domain